MKKNVFAFAVLSGFAGVCAAQSTLTISGKLDQAYGKQIGSESREVADTASSSRLLVRGFEDLGNGVGALFLLEHRFNPDTGSLAWTGNNATSGTLVPSYATKFWHGSSYVGLKTNVGTVTLGRQYTSAYQNVRNQIDPFSGETLVAMREIGTGGTGFVGATRVDDAIKYAQTVGSFVLSADVAENPTPAVAGTKRPFSGSINYIHGPWWTGISYENPQGAKDRLINVGARYKIGAFTLSAGIADGRNNTPVAPGSTDTQKVRNYLLGGIWRVGAGDVKLGYAQARIEGTTINSRVGLGYHHHLSKRTKVFVDIAHDSKGAGALNPTASAAAAAAYRNSLAYTEKNAYDLGVQHSF